MAHFHASTDTVAEQWLLRDRAFGGTVLPVQKLMDECVGVVKLIPLERIQQRTFKEMVDVVPGIQEQTGEVPQVMTEEEFRQVLVPVMRPVDVPV